jgi:hypothetical protein
LSRRRDRDHDPTAGKLVRATRAEMAARAEALGEIIRRTRPCTAVMAKTAGAPGRRGLTPSHGPRQRVAAVQRRAPRAGPDGLDARRGEQAMDGREGLGGGIGLSDIAVAPELGVGDPVPDLFLAEPDDLGPVAGQVLHASDFVEDDEGNLLNPNGAVRTPSGRGEDGSLLVAWEDQTSGSDEDFNDAIVRVEGARAGNRDTRHRAGRHRRRPGRRLRPQRRRRR